MTPTIEIRELTDLVVLGQIQYDFTVSGVEGYDLGRAVTDATYRRAVSVEEDLSRVSEYMRMRMRKVADLGNALSEASYLVAAMSDADIDDKYTAADWGKRHDSLKKLIAPYHLTYTYKDVVYNAEDLLENPTSENLQKLQSTINLALDKENNALTRSSNMVQGFVSKRDNAYAMIGKLRKKLDETAAKTISTIGS